MKNVVKNVTFATMIKKLKNFWWGFQRGKSLRLPFFGLKATLLPVRTQDHNQHKLAEQIYLNFLRHPT